jgi:hypothetical protein
LYQRGAVSFFVLEVRPMNEQSVNGSYQDEPQEAEQDIFRVETERPAVAVGSTQAMDAIGAQESPAEQERTAQIKTDSKMKKHKSKGKEKKKKERGLTAREAIAVKGIVSGLTQKDALMKAGYSENTATHNPDTVLRKNVVIRAMIQALQRAGITEDCIAEKHRALLDCKKVVPIGAGDYIEAEDGQTQIKAVELAYKLRGDFAPELHAVVTESYGQRIKRLRGEKDE